MEKKVEKEIKCLEKKPLAELRKIWKKVYGKEAPQHSRKYLIPRLAYRMQEKEYGEMSRKGAKRLEYLADRLEKGKRISSDKLPVEGTELILERGELLRQQCCKKHKIREKHFSKTPVSKNKSAIYL